jgi:hypothetical protein
MTKAAWLRYGRADGESGIKAQAAFSPGLAGPALEVRNAESVLSLIAVVCAFRPDRGVRLVAVSTVVVFAPACADAASPLATLAEATVEGFKKEPRQRNLWVASVRIAAAAGRSVRAVGKAG